MIVKHPDDDGVIIYNKIDPDPSSVLTNSVCWSTMGGLGIGRNQNGYVIAVHIPEETLEQLKQHIK